MSFANVSNHPAYWFWDPACCRKAMDWARRHWAISLHFVVVCAVLGAGLSFWTIRVSAPAQLAFAQVQTSKIADGVLGSPIRQGFFVTGAVDHVQAGQYADLRMKVYGPQGQGTVFANAAKKNGVWQLTTLDLVVEGRPGQLNLLPIQSTIPR